MKYLKKKKKEFPIWKPSVKANVTSFLLFAFIKYIPCKKKKKKRKKVMKKLF